MAMRIHLALCVVVEGFDWVGSRLIHVQQVLPCKDDRGRAGVHQLGYAVLDAPSNDMLRAEDIHSMHDAMRGGILHLGCCSGTMEDNIHACRQTLAVRLTAWANGHIKKTYML